MKNKKTSKIMVVILMALVILVMPMVLAGEIQDFLTDMENKGSGDYYVLHDLDNDYEFDHIIQDYFADRFDLRVYHELNLNKNFVVITIGGGNNAFPNYSSSRGYTKTETFLRAETGEPVDYTSITLELEPNYWDWIVRLNETRSLQPPNNESLAAQVRWDIMDLNEDEDIDAKEGIYYNLRRTFNILNTYKTNPIPGKAFEIAGGEMIVEETLTCAEFAGYDYDAWWKDEIWFNYQILEDECIGTWSDPNKIAALANSPHLSIAPDRYSVAELTCMEDTGLVEYYLYSCPDGCAYGRCIWRFGTLFYEFHNGLIDYKNFYDSVNIWLKY